MTKIATIDWFGRWGTSVFSESTPIFYSRHKARASVYFGHIS